MATRKLAAASAAASCSFSLPFVISPYETMVTGAKRRAPLWWERTRFMSPGRRNVHQRSSSSHQGKHMDVGAKMSSGHSAR